MVFSVVFLSSIHSSFACVAEVPAHPISLMTMGRVEIVADVVAIVPMFPLLLVAYTLNMYDVFWFGAVYCVLVAVVVAVLNPVQGVLFVSQLTVNDATVEVLDHIIAREVVATRQPSEASVCPHSVMVIDANGGFTGGAGGGELSFDGAGFGPPMTGRLMDESGETGVGDCSGIEAMIAVSFVLVACPSKFCEVKFWRGAVAMTGSGCIDSGGVEGDEVVEGEGGVAGCVVATGEEGEVSSPSRSDRFTDEPYKIPANENAPCLNLSICFASHERFLL